MEDLILNLGFSSGKGFSHMSTWILGRDLKKLNCLLFSHFTVPSWLWGSATRIMIMLNLFGENSVVKPWEITMVFSCVYENFRTLVPANCGLDPVHYYMTPSLTWDTLLKYTCIQIELSTDPEICKLTLHDSHGYLLDVDADYPSHLHDLHNELPLLPEIMDNKLTPNLCPKQHYVCHIQALVQALSHGLVLKKFIGRSGTIKSTGFVPISSSAPQKEQG